MQWTVQLSLVLLNVLWVSFFWTDPLEVFVQRRSSVDSDEEMKVGEFCLQTASDLMWTLSPGPDQTRTTLDAPREKNTPNEAHSEPTYLNSPQPSDIRAPSEDLNDATTATPPLQNPTSAAGTSQLEMISSSKSEAAPVTTTQSLKPRVTQRNKPDRGPYAPREKNTPNKPHSEPTYLNSPQPSDIRASSEDLNEATPSLQNPTSAAGSSHLEKISGSKSEAAPVAKTRPLKPRVKQRNTRNRGRYEKYCLCEKVKSRIISMASVEDIRLYQANIFCRKVQIVVIQKNGFRYCLNPEKGSGKTILEIMKKRESLTPSDQT